MGRVTTFLVWTMVAKLKMKQQKKLSEAGNKTARTTKRVTLTRVVLNKRSTQKALRKEETKEKHKEKLSKEINSLPKIIKEIAEEGKEKLIRQTIAKEEVLKIRPPRLGKHKYEARLLLFKSF